MIRIGKWICYTTGTMLLLAALSLVLYNVNQDKKSGEISQEIVVEIRQMITAELETERTEEEYWEELVQNRDITRVDEKEPEPEPQVTVLGSSYIGILTIPALNLELPVMSTLTYPNLRIAPCRYVGTEAENNLIIGAHNYQSHFGRLSSLSDGSEIVFTDAAGVVHRYLVARIEELPGSRSDRMKEGGGVDWDLTLFTCTYSGRTRVTVRAVKLPEA